MDLPELGLDEPLSDDRWAALGHLAALSLAMMVGAFGAGQLPLYATLSQPQLGLINCLGTGLMLGTSLAVIIPEGLHELYESDGGHHDGHRAGMNEHEDHGHHDHHGGEMTNETIVGLALISGFLLMMMLDNLSCCGLESGGHMHGHGAMDEHKHLHTRDLSDLGLSRARNESHSDDSGAGAHGADDEAARLKAFDQIESGTPSRSTSPSVSTAGSSASTCSQPNGAEAKKRRTTVTIGLLVHAAADGFALGAAKAASAGALRHVELVVFFAIMMHKVPAAFALTIYLRSSGQDLAGIRRNLFAFAAAAPVGAFTIFLLLHPGFLGLGTVSDSIIAFGLLLSGGTFLYVALVHAFQDLPKQSNGELGRMHMLCFALGCILPLVLAAGHEH